MVARDMIPAGCDISPVNGPSLITIDKSSCKIIGVATLAINLFTAAGVGEGIRPAADDLKIPFLITAFIVESLALPVILEHDFLKHFQLDIMYSEKPVRIIGRNTKAGPPGIPWLMRDALDAVDRGVRSRRCCQTGSAASYGSPSVPSSPASMMELESPRMALMAARQREVKESAGRLVTRGVQTADSDGDIMVNGLVNSGSQTEELLVENKAETEVPKEVMVEDKAVAEAPSDAVIAPAKEIYDKPREMDFAREPEHYCVGCAAAFSPWMSEKKRKDSAPSREIVMVPIGEIDHIASSPSFVPLPGVLAPWPG
ncbi:hypothetical protein FOL47_011037 [Perkinsus chesapeaki]|uniref:Uncharacterized protein n=1 Tax=Perkinsus chesapeaki TaxID=330153 RepID=A0A7J6KYV3_PERCH|nr:hypothetical protein FOL47_011037 [Perkinsus chesapeaki]